MPDLLPDLSAPRELLLESPRGAAAEDLFILFELCANPADRFHTASLSLISSVDAGCPADVETQTEKVGGVNEIAETQTVEASAPEITVADARPRSKRADRPRCKKK